MKYFVLFISLLASFPIFAQSSLKGTVKDDKGNPVFAANIFLKKNPQKGTVSDLDGNFMLSISDKSDTLIISFIGYNTAMIALGSVRMNEILKVVLRENSKSLNEVFITARDPVSEKFSVVKLDKMKIYLNPVSQGDPLKAITILPASTTSDESASPSLRGSDADRTRVELNNVPIYNPVRNSQINGIGNFSIFNPEIIDRQYVYASNPPLTFGNSSAGIIDIETVSELPGNQLQLSLSLASTGVFISKKITNKSFMQIFGNCQFSKSFIELNKTSLPILNKFYTRDLGLNFHTSVGKHITFNTFNYFISEGYNVNIEEFTYAGKSLAEKTRFFSVNNLKYHTKNGILSINNGIDFSLKEYQFGNIKSKNHTDEFFASVDYRWLITGRMSLQSGLSYDHGKSRFNDSIPVYYYDIHPRSPAYYSDTTASCNIPELYSYLSWDFLKKWSLSSGIRSNIQLNKNSYYLSSQLGLKYRFKDHHSVLLSGGEYHSYSTPNYYSKKFTLLTSYQLALDYSFEYNKSAVTAALYYKKEKGEQINQIFIPVEAQKIFGTELFYEQSFSKYFKFTFSNSFIHQVSKIYNRNYRGEKDYNYFAKITVNYNDPKIVSFTVSYLGRPGDCYTPVGYSVYDARNGFYQPYFSTDINGSRYNSYNRIDISADKYLKFKKNSVIVFASLNNIFNTKNEDEVLYNHDYTLTHFNYYELRTIYFGVVVRLNTD